MSRGAAPSPPEEFRAGLTEAAPRFGLLLADASLDRMARYLAFLDLSRRQTNLTGRLSPEELVSHALESALGEKLIPHGARVIDIGSGAGFPGVPLAIVRPDSRVTPVEPRRKRAEFLSRVAEQLPLENLLVSARSLSRLPEGSADVATARAVGSIDRLLRDAPFLRPGGLFLAWTTDAHGLSGALHPLFLLEAELPVPGSRRKAIVSLRKTEIRVPRETQVKTDE